MSFGPIIQVDSMGRAITSSSEYLTERIEYDANNNPTYIGRARPGAGTDKEVWQISFLEYDANNNAVSRKWAGGSAEFKFEWDDRGTYTYS